MKIMIVSDTHRKHQNLMEALHREQPIDLLIHLGDAEGTEQEIAQMAGCPVEIVAGNNDFFSDLPREKELWLGAYRVLLTHGHYYYVTTSTERIKKEAEAGNYDIVMFGHTHRPLVDCSTRTMLINPGSISYPRQEGRQPSYIRLNLERNEKPQFEIMYL
ncbi:MAG: metallophosphoesterase [Clostridiales bacterium]|nr:metallophosphoesterase [Clostridiales bacterium]